MSLSMTLYPLPSTGSTQETSRHGREIVDWNVKHLKQTKDSVIILLKWSFNLNGAATSKASESEMQTVIN